MSPNNTNNRRTHTHYFRYGSGVDNGASAIQANPITAGTQSNSDLAGAFNHAVEPSCKYYIST